eukprot:TRINITY_DN585_c0_g7_i1.p2 TRINITY_DN585_c0_g7~~TRINITY_DN585_c0_g7_i1.p2  ORF type:complete len:100 (+),score=38.32 TRINITY_DN585_c0_g7_i1:167-466(+)
MLRFSKFAPLLDRVLVQKLEPITKTKAGIILSEKEVMKNYGRVVAVGPGSVQKGKTVPVSVKVGQNVLLPEYGGNTFKLSDDKEYTIYRDEDILGVLEE